MKVDRAVLLERQWQILPARVLDSLPAATFHDCADLQMNGEAQWMLQSYWTAIHTRYNQQCPHVKIQLRLPQSTRWQLAVGSEHKVAASCGVSQRTLDWTDVGSRRCTALQQTALHCTFWKFGLVMVSSSMLSSLSRQNILKGCWAASRTLITESQPELRANCTAASMSSAVRSGLVGCSSTTHSGFHRAAKCSIA